MEEVLDRLHMLTPDQLRQEILAAGLKCGPITVTTRAIFERKLARFLLEKDGSAPDGANGGLAAGREEGAARGPGLSSEEVKGEEAAAPCGEVEDSPSDSPPVYYGICPQQDESSGTGKVHVFVNRKKALRAMGAMKGPRFKAFSTREEAEGFSKGAGDHIPAPGTTLDGPQTTEPSEFIETPPPPSNSEKANEFHSPRTQDLTTKLRKSVEQDDQEAFSRLVWDNPRYLIGSGDNPTIVQEGCHYNVLHVAAKENQAGMVRVLLDTLESLAFMRLMYPEDQETMLHQRIRHLVDLYLNTPDKTNNDTPLHHACKFGCAEVVNVLCSHPTTDKHRRNKWNQKPSSVICDRKNKTPDIKRKIKDYLEDRCYVPLMRDTDNSFQPVIGSPWSPSPLEGDIQPVGSGPEGRPIDPVLTVRAFVGPLCPSKAEEFYRLWRTPPRERAEYFHQILKSDPARGVERVGREIAHGMGHVWTEYWDFLDSFVDLSTEEGLKRLEEHLDRKEDSMTPQHNNNSRGTDPADSPQCTPSLKAEKKTSVSPVCNLLPEFEKASVVDGSLTGQKRQTSETGDKGLDLTNGSFWEMWGWRQKQGKQKQEQRQEEEELSSCCSEDYLTADDGSEWSDYPGEDRRDRKDSVSSYSSCQSTGDTAEDTALIQELSTSQAMFIEGDSPSRLDREVMCAVENIDIDPERFPYITKWKNTVLSYPSPQRLSWPSPVQKKRPTETQGSLSPSGLSSPSWSPRSGNLLSPGTLGHGQGAYTNHILCRTLFKSPK